MDRREDNNRRVTIKDIAEEIGVSTATVSNVIHGKTKKISDRTVAKVQEKLQESGYIPNMAAVLLAQNSSKIVCVVLSDHEKYEGKMLEDPFVSQMINTISKELSSYGYFMMIKEERNIEQIVTYASMWNMAGLILMGYCSVDYEQLRSKMHIPFVVVDSYEKDIKSYIDIGIDNIEGGYLAGKHLISKGHEKVLYFADNKEDCDLDRYLGLRKAFAEMRCISSNKGNKEELGEVQNNSLRIEVSDRKNNICQIIPEYYLVSIDKMQRMTDYERMSAFILENEISAVFAASDCYALEFMRFLLKGGIKVPDDISIIGFDDIPLASQVYPALTTISQNIPIRGKMAVEMLHNQIEDQTAGKSILLSVELKDRESVKDITEE